MLADICEYKRDRLGEATRLTQKICSGKERSVCGKEAHLIKEQTKFYDLRRGITEDFQRLAKNKDFIKKHQKDPPILSNMRF